MKFLVTGATGFIGRLLCTRLQAAGHKITVLSRDAKRAQSALGADVGAIEWSGKDWHASIEQSDVVIHLAGAGVADHRWTPEVKARILSSRTETTRSLVDAMRHANRKPDAFLCCSAIGFYGDCKDAVVTESSPSGNGFLADVCKRWEEEASAAEELGVRVARMRVGLVLGVGGALERMIKPLPGPISPWKLGLGGPMGSGRQWISWIHVEDAVDLFFRTATEQNVSGAVNVVSPQPVTNRDFAHALGKALHRPSVLPLPGFMLRAILGEFAETLLTGQRVLPTVAQNLDWTFRHSGLDAALSDLVKKM